MESPVWTSQASTRPSVAQTPSRRLLQILPFWTLLATAILASVTRAVDIPASWQIPPDLAPAERKFTGSEDELAKVHEALGKPLRPEMHRLFEARKKLRQGIVPDDPQMWDFATSIHRNSTRLLEKGPVAVDDFLPVPYLVWTEEALACKASLEGKRDAFDQHIARLLAWQRWLIQGRGQLLDLAVAGASARFAFDALLVDWERHPNQSDRLAELDRLAAKTRIPTVDLLEVAKRELAWYHSQGGIHGFLKSPETSVGLTMFLREPFNKLTREELLELPLDRDAEFKAAVADTRQTIEVLRRGEPYRKMPGAPAPHPARSLDDYRKMPNGLDRLLREQSELSPLLSTYGVQATGETLVDACLRWLRAEKDGRDLAKEPMPRDPFTGDSLRLDIMNRCIRAPGTDLRFDDDSQTPGPPGFVLGGNDTLLVVPRWQRGTP